MSAVAGSVLLFEHSFSPYELLQQYQHEHIDPVSCGATASFIGTMRDHNENVTVHRMFLEHYPGMTERQLQELIQVAQERWQFTDALIAHRVGEISPGDTIMLAVVWSAHRSAAFAACQQLVESLKSQAPFWKKEVTAQGERWVARNTPVSSG